jgi:hypothetical protein
MTSIQDLIPDSLANLTRGTDPNPIVAQWEDFISLSTGKANARYEIEMDDVSTPLKRGKTIEALRLLPWFTRQHEAALTAFAMVTFDGAQS